MKCGKALMIEKEIENAILTAQRSEVTLISHCYLSKRITKLQSRSVTVILWPCYVSIIPKTNIDFWN